MEIIYKVKKLIYIKIENRKENKMKSDRIIKNAKIFTSDKDNPKATALVVKDGKFIYVGDESGFSEYEGEVTDLGGKFIMPSIIDSHVHVTIPVGFEYAEPGERIEPNGKQEALNIMAKYVKENPGLKRYRFLLEKKFLSGEDIVKEDLDVICPDAELQIQEGEGHSIWVNSKILERHGINDDTFHEDIHGWYSEDSYRSYGYSLCGCRNKRNYCFFCRRNV